MSQKSTGFEIFDQNFEIGFQNGAGLARVKRPQSLKSP